MCRSEGVRARVPVLAVLVMAFVLPGCSVASPGEADADGGGRSGTVPQAQAYDLTEAVAGFDLRVPLFKRYPSAPRVSLTTAVPADGLYGALASRRSRRSFGDGGLTLARLSRLLWAAAGVTGSRWGVPLRTAPSGGALYPVEVYVAVTDVEGLPPGLYHLAVEDFALERLREGSLRDELRRASLEQTGRGEGCVIVLTLVTGRTTQKYGDRGERYGWMEAGAVMQNLLLAAEAEGLGACPMGAFHDEGLARILGVSARDEVPALVVPVGRR